MCRLRYHRGNASCAKLQLAAGTWGSAMRLLCAAGTEEMKCKKALEWRNMLRALAAMLPRIALQYPTIT